MAIDVARSRRVYGRILEWIDDVQHQCFDERMEDSSFVLPQRRNLKTLSRAEGLAFADQARRHRCLRRVEHGEPPTHRGV